MARVLAVTAASIFVSSIFSVSGRMSTKTGTPPRSTKAFAVETKAKDGMITSSPGCRSTRIAAISSAAVQECVSNTLREPIRFSNHALHCFVKAPSPER